MGKNPIFLLAAILDLLAAILGLRTAILDLLAAILDLLTAVLDPLPSSEENEDRSEKRDWIIAHNGVPYPAGIITS